MTFDEIVLLGSVKLKSAIQFKIALISDFNLNSYRLDYG